MAIYIFACPLEYLINLETSCTHVESDSLIKVESCNVLLRSYLQSGLRHKFLMSDTYPPDILYYKSTNVEILGCFWKPKRVREQKSFGNSNAIYMAVGLCTVTYGYRIPVRKEMFPFSKSFGPPLSPKQPHIQWVPWSSAECKAGGA